LNRRLDEQALREAMNIRNKKETKSMLVDTIHTWSEELRSEGEKIGEKRGEKIGEKRGEKKNALKTAKKLLGLNSLSVEQIADITELSLEEVRKMQSPDQLKTAP
jgi:predicted transposase YdaD